MCLRPLCALVALLFTAVLLGCEEETKPPEPQAQPSQSKPETPPRKEKPPRPPVPADRLTYPRDKDRVMARVNGRDITLGELIQHIDQSHFSGFEAYVSTSVGQFEIRSPQMATWTRQFADVIALRTEARKRDISEVTIQKEAAAVLGTALEDYRKEYRKNKGRKFPTAPASVKALTDNFLKTRGLGLEVEALLNALVPDDVDQANANEFYKRNNEPVNGLIHVAHIYVRNRDQKTGARFRNDQEVAVNAKVAEIERRLKAGDVFETVAREMSEDPSTAAEGGVLENLLRIDLRMPASFCRAAWALKDGAWTGPVETPYGLHFVKRLKWIRKRHIVALKAENKDVRRMIRAYRREDMLFKVRADHRVELVY